MVPTKVTDLLPQSLADWLTGRRRATTANGSVPAEQPSASEREEERTPPPPAKRARYDVNLPTYFTQAEVRIRASPPVRSEPEPLAALAGPSFKPDQPATSPVKEDRWKEMSMFGRSRSIARHSLGKKEPIKKNESPLKPAESPVQQSVTPTGSPFYPGRTRYGGASARYVDEPNIRERRVAVPSKPMCSIDNSISATTRRLMGLLERSSPHHERRAPVRLDTSNQTLHSSGLNSSGLMGRSVAVNSAKTQELQISHLPTLLKLRQGARLRESTRLARTLAARHAPLAPYPAGVASAPDASSQEIQETPMRELSKQTNKIKSQVGRSGRQGSKNVKLELAPTVNLPQATLNIDQANLPTFSFTPPVQQKNKELPKSTELIKNTEFPKNTEEPRRQQSFKFSMPEIVTHNHISVPSQIGGFKFSKPTDATEKKLTNGPTMTSTPIQSAWKQSPGWKCDDCWVSNKETDDKCCACTAPKPVKKLDKPPAKDWQCKDCWVFNKDNVDKCVACTGSRMKEATSDSLMVKAPAKQWKCNDCWVQNKDEDTKCVACGGSKPGNADKPAEKVIKDWQCKDCWVFNKDAADKCIACGGAKPGTKPEEKVNAFTGFSQKSSNKWTCNDCWVSNDDAADKCIACGGANPKKPVTAPAPKSDLFSDLVKKQNELWECPSCLTRNNSSVSKCICCETTRPGSKKNEDTKFNFSPTPAFKFGIPSSTAENKTVEKEKESIIESNNNNPAKSVSFTFGIPKSSEVKKVEAEPPKFSFGTPSSTADKPSFTFNAPTSVKKPEDKSELDGVKLSLPSGASTGEKKEPAFKLPGMSTGLFTFNATPKEPAKSAENKDTPSQVPSLFGTPKTSENSSPASGLFTLTSSAKSPMSLPSTTKSDNASSLFVMPSTVKTNAVSLSTSATSTVFGIQGTAKTDTATTSSTLFGISPGKSDPANTSGTLFGMSSTPKTDISTTTSTMFSIPSAGKTDTNISGTLFGIPSAAKPESSNVSFSSPAIGLTASKSESTPQTTQQALFTFGSSNEPASKSSKFNFTFGSTSADSAPVFNASFGPSSVTPAFGISTTQASLPAFGSITTQASTIPTFGSITSQSKPPPAFGSLTSQSSTVPTFGTLTTQSNSTPSFGTSSIPAFGAQTAQPPAFGTPTFGSSTVTPAFGAPSTQSTPAFGAPATQTMPAFGAPSTQSTPAFGTLPAQSTPTFGASSSQTPAFGTPTTQPPAFGTQTTQASTFAPPNVNLFASQANTGLFGSSNVTSPQNKPFSFGSSTTMFGSQPTQGMFGSPAQQNASTELFPTSNQSMFNAQPANPTPMGMFGSTPAFGAGQTSNIPSLGHTQGLGQQNIMGQGGQLGQQGGFNFGSAGASPVFAFGQQAPQPQQGVYNFGAAAAPSVQFTLGSSTGTPQAAAPTRRPVRRAMRRTQR